MKDVFNVSSTGTFPAVVQLHIEVVGSGWPNDLNPFGQPGLWKALLDWDLANCITG